MRVTALACLILATFSLPLAAAELPAACDLSSVMPPSKNTQAFETVLIPFIGARCYEKLGWTNDPLVRDTGPYIEGDYYGTHPAVRVWYSPDVASWIKLPAAKRATTPIADNAIIVKEMFKPPAAQYSAPPNPNNGVTVMVRDSNGAFDGWYWSGTSPVSTDLGNTAYPAAGFGNYCINCHASAAADNTYATMRNVEGTNAITYLNVTPTMDPPKSVHPDAHRSKEERKAGGPLLSGAIFDMEILKILAPWWKPADKLTYRPLPGETWDHVLSLKNGPEQFITSDQCLGCHDATGNIAPYPANMLYPAAGSPPDAKGNPTAYNVSPYGEWRASLMGLSGRDPVFFSQIASELTIHKNAQLPTTIPNICFRCHGAMGQRQLAIDSNQKRPFEPEMIYAWQPTLAQPTGDAKYGALARDSVSCTVCHHISDKDLGKPSTYTGQFNTTDPKTIIGPFADPQVLPMNHSLNMQPMHVEYVKESKLCGSCHTIELPVLNAKGVQVRTDFEQTTYFEWQNSVFQNEQQPVSKEAQTCQDCHTPSTFKLKEFHSQNLQYRIANIEDNTYPYVDDRLPDKDISLQTRKPFARHTLVGINLFVQEMFLQFSQSLGIRTIDPMLADSTTAVKGLALAEQATIDLARQETATVEILSTKKAASNLEVQVRVTNNAGHSFPSGVSFRRAFLNFEVLDAAGKPIWASGATNQFGMITNGPGGMILPSEFFDGGRYQDHYTEIKDQSQVQIYEELVKDTEGRFTTSFLSLFDNVKKNRLLPRGWKPNGPHAAETAPHGSAAKDPDYLNGCGCDTIIYRIPLAKVPGAARVQAKLFYQTIPPYYLRQRFNDTYNPATRSAAENTERLMDFVARLNVGATEIHEWKLFVAGKSAPITN
jgi:nitrate/TMAO reductase-like tetraheme cytochrome c subunit